MKTQLDFFLAAVAAATASATPVVTAVEMSQSDSSRTVTVTYTVSEPAVVTLDVQTNSVANAADGWAGIGGEALSNATGDVWQKVSAGAHTITWRPDRTWPDHVVPDGCARAVVTAWALDNTPDYMVVDLSAAAQPNTEKYYPAAEYLPGGLLGNDEYRTTRLVMRKILAEGVSFTMGATTLEPRQDTRENTHDATLDSNYYIGVFEVTQAQYALLDPPVPQPSTFTYGPDRAMRPVETVGWNELRTTDGTNNKNNSAYYPPAAPNPLSWLGRLRARTGIDFDLPGEAQWEWACRAGNGDTKWNDGSAILAASNSATKEDANLSRLARYVGSASNTAATASTPAAEGGTAIVGSYAPNSWGLYDMHGNVWEWCLDWYAADISSLHGAVNTANIASSGSRHRRGGDYASAAGNCRSATRNGSNAESGKSSYFGFRVACPVEAK